VIVTHSAEETRALGARLAKVLQRGDVLLLQGNLGAGKSELARGIARGLGVKGPVPSPSFTILNAYDEGRLPLYHFDWYRIEDPEEIAEMGMEEQLGGDGVALIEWRENGAEYLPSRVLKICIRPIDENDREISFAPQGGFSFREEDIL
jgi:tRNA threonylcarbamoyladenosine biosynthesis protein TsaE